MFGNPTGLYKPTIAKIDEEIRKLKIELANKEQERADYLIAHYAVRRFRYRMWRIKNAGTSEI